jgi:nitrate/nitrite transporter NarK
MLSGLGLFFGNIGALTAQVPLRLMIEHFGWRAVVLGSGAVVLGVCVLAWAVVRNDPAEKKFRTYAPPALQRKSRIADLRAGFRKVFEYRNTWLIFFAQGSMVGSILAFTGLWGTPFLKARFGLAPASAAAVCSVMIVCWAVASPVCGAWSDRIGRRKPIYMSGCLVATVGWIVMFYAALPLAAFVAVAALTSAACGAVVLGFAYGKESVPVQFLGTISGTINIGNMIGPMLLQPGIGRILDQRWSGQTVNGLRVYGVDAFQTAFLLMVAWLVLACVLISLTRETYCKPTA